VLVASAFVVTRSLSSSTVNGKERCKMTLREGGVMTTARPWITKDRTDGLKNIYHAAGVHDVALCAKPDDADLIVKAVNDYDRLRRDNAVLREALQLVEGMLDNFPGFDSRAFPFATGQVGNIGQEVRAALKQAEANEPKSDIPACDRDDIWADFDSHKLIKGMAESTD